MLILRRRFLYIYFFSTLSCCDIVSIATYIIKIIVKYFTINHAPNVNVNTASIYYSYEIIRVHKRLFTHDI